MSNDELAGLQQRAARNAAISFSGAVGAAILGFALFVLVGRTFGPAGAGLFATVAAVFFILSNAVELGADTSLTWALPRLRAHGRVGDVRATVRVAMKPVWLASIFTGAAVFGLAPYLAQVLFPPESADTGTLLLRIAAPALVLAAPMTVALAGTRGLGSVVPFTVVGNLAVPFLRPALILVVAAVTTGGAMAVLPWVIAAWSLPIALGCAAAFVLLARGVRRWEREVAEGLKTEKQRSSSVISREFWTYSRPRAVSAMLEIALVWVDVILLSAIAGPAAAGIYASASRFVTTGTLAEAAMRVALSPQLSQLLAGGNLRVAGRLIGTASVWITAVSWPLYLALATFSPFVLKIFGPEFAEGATALTILSLAMAVSLTAGNVQSVLLMSGRSAWQMGNKAVALTLDIGLCLVLIPRYGMAGAAMAWATAILVDTALAYWQVRYLLGVRADAPDPDASESATPPPSRRDVRTGMLDRVQRRGLALAPVAAAALVTFGGFGVLLRSVTDGGALAFTAYLLLAGSVYAALLWVLRPLLEVDVVLAAFRRRGRR